MQVHTKLFRLGTLLAILLLAQGCAVGVRIPYENVMLDVKASGADTKIGVVALDLRPYILSGEKSPEYVGTCRGGYGNPFNVSTQSGKPLAEVMADAISSGLRRKGFEIVPVQVSRDPQSGDAECKFVASPGKRIVMLVVTLWKSDTFQNTALIYDASLKVLDQAGGLVAESSVSGKDNLGGSAWNPPAAARRAVPEAFKKKIEELLNHPDVVNALQ
jgi:hypothetical protein